MDKNKILFFLLSLVIVISILSCKKEDTPAPSVIIQTDSIFVPSSAWNPVYPNYYSVSLTNAHITADVVNNGTIDAFVYNDADSQWYALNDVVAGGAGYRYAFKVGTLTLFADNFPSVPIPRSFKIVIISNNK